MDEARVARMIRVLAIAHGCLAFPGRSEWKRLRAQHDVDTEAARGTGELERAWTAAALASESRLRDARRAPPVRARPVPIKLALRTSQRRAPLSWGPLPPWRHAPPSKRGPRKEI